MTGFQSKRTMAQDKLGRTYVYLVQHINLDMDIIEPVGVYTTEEDAKIGQAHFIEDSYMLDPDDEGFESDLEDYKEYVQIVRMELL